MRGLVAASSGRIRDWIAAWLVLVVGSLTAEAQIAPDASRGPTANVHQTAYPLGGIRAGVATLMLGGRDGGDLRLAATALPDGDDGLVVWVEIVGADVLPAAAPRDERTAADPLTTVVSILEAYVYAFAPQRAVAGFGGVGFTLDPEVEDTTVTATGVRLAVRIEVARPPVEVRVLVRRQGDQRFGLLTVPLVAGGDDEASTPRLWLPAGATPWATVLGPGIAADRPAPAALPVWSVAGAIGVGLSTPDSFGEVASAALRLRRLGDPDASAIEIPLQADVGVAVGTVDDPTVDDAGRWTATVPAMPAGAYLLDARVTDGGGAVHRSPPMRAAVVAERAVAERGWPSLVMGDADDHAAAAVEAAAARSRARRIEAYAAAYRRALDAQAAGGTTRALTTLRAAEQSAHDDVRLRGDLSEAQARVAATLASVDPEALVPMLSLHLAAYEVSLASREASRAAFTRQRIEALGLRYGETARHPLAPALASGALTRVGVSLLGRNLVSAAAGVLRRAVSLDPDHVPALRHLAMAEELAARHAEAVAALERWLTVDPAATEAWLRLGINHRRLGDDRAALQALRRGLTSARAPWLLALAYQELARLHLDADRIDDAIAVLSQGRERLPGQRRLALLMAHAHDRAGDHRRARAVIEDLPSPADAATRPRLRYGRVSDDGDEASSLAAAAVARLPALAQALAASGAQR